MNLAVLCELSAKYFLIDSDRSIDFLYTQQLTPSFRGAVPSVCGDMVIPDVSEPSVLLDTSPEQHDSLC